MAAQRDVRSKKAFADLMGVSASRVSQWVAEGQIRGAALVGTGRAARIDVNRAAEQLRSSLDPGRRKARTKPDDSLFGWIEETTDDPGERLALRLGATMLYRVGALAARAAIEAGADIKTAFALRAILSEHFPDLLDGVVGELMGGLSIDHMPFDRRAIADIDWPAQARAIGEPVDPAAWAAWLAHRDDLRDEADRLAYLKEGT